MLTSGGQKEGLSRAVVFRWLALLLVVCGAISAFFPFFWMAVTSLKTAPEIQRVPLQVFPDSWTNWQNYREVFTRHPFARYLLNSALIASTAAISSLVISSLAGYGFAKFRFPGRDFFFFGIIGILMVPFQSVVVPLYGWVSRLGLLDTYLGIVAPDLVSVFGIFLMRQAIEVLPNDYMDAARIDGCNKFQVYWHVAMPLAKPAIGVLAVFNALAVWNEYLLAMLVLSDRSLMPLQRGLMVFEGAHITEYPLLMAGIAISIVPIVTLYFMMQRYIVAGITAGALKM